MKCLISFCLLFVVSAASANEAPLVQALRQGDYKLNLENVRFGFGYNYEKVCSDFNEDSECVDARHVFVADKDLGVEPYTAKYETSYADTPDQNRYEILCRVNTVIEKKTYETDVRELGMISEDVKFRYVYAIDKNDEWDRYHKIKPDYFYFNHKPQYSVAVVDATTVVETNNFPYEVCWADEYAPTVCNPYFNSRRVEFQAIVTPRVRLQFKCESAVISPSVANPEITVEQVNQLFKNGYLLTK